MEKEIADYFNQYKNFGTRVVSKLGAGHNGIVYLTDKNFAIKYTKDEAEVKTALSIARRINGRVTPRFKHIKILNNNSFIIVMEKVTPISISDKENKLLNMFSEKLTSALESGVDIQGFKKSLVGKLGSPKFENILSGLIDALSELKNIGIINADIHEDNIGMIGNKVVLLDVIDEKYLVAS